MSRELSPAECRAWLTKSTEGRLGHLTGRGPRSTVVGYAVTDDKAIFRLPEFNEICQYAPGRPITLSVDCGTTSHVRTTVLVTGVGHVPEDNEDLVEVLDLLEKWPSSVSTHLICLDLAVIEGDAVLDESSPQSRPNDHLRTDHVLDNDQSAQRTHRIDESCF